MEKESWGRNHFPARLYAHTLGTRDLCLLFSPDPRRHCLEPATRTFHPPEDVHAKNKIQKDRTPLVGCGGTLTVTIRLCKLT